MGGIVMAQGSRGSEDESAESIRVGIQILDSLMNQVGELVLIRNQFLQVDLNLIAQNDFMNLSQRLNVVTTELQTHVMRTRMQPVGRILNKFTRVVRDISQELGKSIQLLLEGTETELDKSLIEAIKDPLTHIVRNSCDHGIEEPNERKKANKSELGTILIRSFHEGGQVVIEIKDDGKGLSPESLKEKAIDKGILNTLEASQLSDREAFNLIFHPGFSTAKKVSNLSGRGVGMDVVKTNIERIGGQVELHSVPTQGTTIRLKIPLTLAILPALIVSTGGHRFAIPQLKLVELIRVDISKGDKIEWLQGKPMYRLRGDILPLVHLSALLNNTKEGFEAEGQDINIAILRSDFAVFGLILDQIETSADIVVKPMASFLTHLRYFSGATVLGNGEVALVLDVNDLGDHLSLNNIDSLHKSEQEAQQEDQEIAEYLMVDLGKGETFGIPLSYVNRLEEFPKEKIESSADHQLVQYRGRLLPLVSLTKALALKTDRPSKKELYSVVVIAQNDQLVGLLVEAIKDVRSSAHDIDLTIRDRKGLLGTLKIRDQIVPIIDVEDILESCKSNLEKAA